MLICFLPWNSLVEELNVSTQGTSAENLSFRGVRSYNGAYSAIQMSSASWTLQAAIGYWLSSPLSQHLSQYALPTHPGRGSPKQESQFREENENGSQMSNIP